MTVKITIIGLGQIGASIGLALANHKDQVTTLGHDKVLAVARSAQQQGAVEQTSINLPRSVDGADVVILALPLDQIYETLKYITLDVREQAVIMDTAPAKATVAGWVRELFPQNRHYVGLSPAINARRLEESGRGLAAARADLFQKGLVAISSPPGTPGEAISLAASLVTLLGAQPYFMDMAEVDGVMASAHLLPVLAAGALTDSIMKQAGWPDIRKVTGKPFMAAMNLLELEEPGALAEMAGRNRDSLVRMLNEYIGSLETLRDELAAEENGKVSRRLVGTVSALEQWRQERFQGDWKAVEFTQPELPKVGDVLKQHVGGLDKLFGRRGRKPTKSE